MSKLTFSVDPTVVARAKRYAILNGIFLVQDGPRWSKMVQDGPRWSKIVEAYLASISVSQPATKTPPVLRKLRGILKRADPADYKRHLAAKYR